MADIPIKIIVDAAIEGAKRGLEEVKKTVEDVSSSLEGFGTVTNLAMNAVMAFAGTKGLLAMTTAYDEQTRYLAKAEMYLRSWSQEAAKDTEILREEISQFKIAREVGIDYATTIAALLFPKAKELNKARQWGVTLLEAEKVAGLSAEYTAKLLSKAAEGGARAIWLLNFALGTNLNEFMGLDTIMEEVRRKIEGLSENVAPFTSKMNELKNILRDLMAKAMEPLVDEFLEMADAVRKLMTDFPLFEKIFVKAAPAIAGALALMGFLGFTDTLLGLSKALGITKLAFVGWGMAIATGLGIAIWYFKEAQEYGEHFIDTVIERMPELFALFFLLGTLLWGPIGGTILAFLAALAIWFANYIRDYEFSWSGFKRYLSDTWEGIKIIGIEQWTALVEALKVLWYFISKLFKEIWEGMKTWFDTVIVPWFESKYNWVKDKVDAVKRWATEIWETISRIPGWIGERLPGFQYGGYIPETGPYLLHRGEYVVPAGRGGGGAAINITITGNTFMTDEEGAVKIGDLIVKVLQRQLRI